MSGARWRRWFGLALLVSLGCVGQGCDSSAADEQVTRGRRLYETSCGFCHQRSGVGKYGEATPLVKTSWVLGSQERLVRIALQGVRGPIDVNGKIYNLEMPGFDRAYGDQDLAAILSYIRQAWGNDASTVTTETVAAIRERVKDRGDSWTAEELLAID